MGIMKVLTVATPTLSRHPLRNHAATPTPTPPFSNWLNSWKRVSGGGNHVCPPSFTQREDSCGRNAQNAAKTESWTHSTMIATHTHIHKCTHTARLPMALIPKALVTARLPEPRLIISKPWCNAPFSGDEEATVSAAPSKYLCSFSSKLDADELEVSPGWRGGRRHLTSLCFILPLSICVRDRCVLTDVSDIVNNIYFF